MDFLNDLLSELMVALDSTEVTLENSAFRLVLSMILGMMVGMERKRKGQVAGVRTFALISMGACMAMTGTPASTVTMLRFAM